MTGLNPTLNLIVATLVVGGIIAFLSLRRYLAKGRIRNYTGGKLPETLDYGVVFFGFSTDQGRLRPRKGTLFATSEALVFLGLELRSDIVEMKWRSLSGWSTTGEFRGRPLERKVLTFTLIGDIGNPREAAFAVPRPEFWTSLIDVAIKSVKKD